MRIGSTVSPVRLRPRLIRLLTALALAGLPALAPAPALAKTETASAGSVTATLSYDRSSKGFFRNVRMAVTRSGSRLVDDPGPRFGKGCSDRCEYAPLNVFAKERSIFVLNLDRDAEPEVLGDFYTGGANCCAASRIYDFDPAAGAYRRIDRNWRTGVYNGALDLDHDGALELQAADGRFAYRFGCGACTPQPVQIFRFRGGRLRDVTRRFPKVIRRDLREHARAFHRVRKDRLSARGVLPALVADRYLLGQGKRARRTLSAALRKGYLRGTRGDFVPDGKAYVRALLRFLRRAGYRG